MRSSPNMPVVKRLLDVVISVGAFVAVSPVLVVAAAAIKISSAGPVLYRAQRMARDRRVRHTDAPQFQGRHAERRHADGYGGREFTMYKFRTMRVGPGDQAVPITAPGDHRVYPFGRFLRMTKIDELPQLFNVLKGDMSIVGPRPEAPEIVRSRYTRDDLTTLHVRPGVTSPGTLYYYTHCERTLNTDRVVDQYVQELLPTKLALDRVYLRSASVLYDLRIVFRTIFGITSRIAGRKSFPDPPEMRQVDLNRLVANGPLRVGSDRQPENLHPYSA